LKKRVKRDQKLGEPKNGRVDKHQKLLGQGPMLRIPKKGLKKGTTGGYRNQ